MARALVCTGSPDVITNPSDVFLTGFDLYTLANKHLEFQTLDFKA